MVPPLQCKGEKSELYNLVKDPKQQTDVLKENWDVAVRLHRDFVALLRSSGTDAHLLEPRLEITE